MTKPNRNAVFATITFSDAFERWKADKTDAEDVLIMRFYNEYLDDETRRKIEGISDVLTAPSTGLPYKQRESKEQTEQRWRQVEEMRGEGERLRESRIYTIEQLAEIARSKPMIDESGIIKDRVVGVAISKNKIKIT